MPYKYLHNRLKESALQLTSQQMHLGNAKRADAMIVRFTEPITYYLDIVWIICLFFNEHIGI